MPRPRHWELLALLLAGAALVGCDKPRGCLEGCGTGGDAGQSGQPHGPGTLDACPMQRACPHVTTVGPISTQSLGGAATGTVHLGNALETPIGPAVSFVVLPDQSWQTPQMGVAFPEQGKVVPVGAGASTANADAAPVLFQRDGEVDVIPAPGFNQVIPIALDTLTAGASVPITLGAAAGSTPAVAGIGQALAAVVDPGPHLQFFGTALGDPLLNEKLGGQNAVHALALAPTCNGLLASWGSSVAAFTPLGDRAAPDVDTKLFIAPSQPHYAVWDGGEVVISGSGGVVEVDSKGKVLSRTTGAFGPAVGTDDGLLTIDGSSGEAVIRERKTGGIVKSYSMGGALVPDAVAVTNRYVYFFQAGSSSVVWIGIGCSA